MNSSTLRPKPTIFIDSNEAQDDRNELLMHYLKKYFGEQNVIKKSLPVDFSFFTKDKEMLGERKVTPSDFLASIADGRLKQQAITLATVQGFLLLEGKLVYNREGLVMDGSRVRQFTIAQLTGLLMTLQQSGIKLLWSDSVIQTPAVIHEAYNWYSKDGTTSFVDGRPRPNWTWGVPSMREKVLWAFQGFGVGPKTALRVWKEARTLRAFLDMETKERQAIPGIGPTLAKKADEILDKEYTEK